MIGGLALDVGNLCFGEAEALAVHHLSTRSAFDGSGGLQYFYFFIEYSAWTWNGSSSCSRISLSLVYHCFDRIVIHGYSERFVAARAGYSLFLPARPGHPGGEQRNPLVQRYQ